MIADTNLTETEKSEILGHLKMVSLLCSHGEILLGKKKKFSNYKVELSEIFEILDAILKEHIKKTKVKLAFPKTNMTVQGDRDAIMNGLEYILMQLFNISKNIEVHANKKGAKISIKYDSDQQLKFGKDGLIEHLRKGTSFLETFFKVNVHLLNMSGVKTNFKKGLVEIVLKN